MIQIIRGLSKHNHGNGHNNHSIANNFFNSYGAALKMQFQQMIIRML